MTASEQIDEIIAGLTDWRGPVIARIRKIIHEADPVVTEEIKWRGAPVWSHDGNICVVGAFKEKVKLTFPDGAKLPDPEKLFNNGFEGNQWRAIDIYENDKINEESFKSLVLAAVEYNQNKANAKSITKPRATRSKKSDERRRRG